MSPVADCNLASYMEKSIKSVDKQSLLRTFFGCLCNGLQYLHQSKIRHRDVKPENILVKGEKVLWTDFGISLDWEHMSRSTTTTDFGHSPVYCAPEVANLEARNSSSDIWSLGCVFLEMTTILKGQTVSQMRQNFMAYSENYRFYNNIIPLNLWIEHLYSLESDRDNKPLEWAKSMLNVNRRDRPTAQTLFNTITQQQAESDTSFSPAEFCGLCCLKDDDSSFGSESDGEQWIEEPEEQRTLHPYLFSVNLDPALAQADQYAALESNTYGEQDPGQSSSNASSNNTFPHRHNNAGDSDEDGDALSSVGTLVGHLQSANIESSIDHMFLGSTNNQGKGSPTRGDVERDSQSRHRDQKSTCTFPGCKNNKGKGFATPQSMKRHIESRHLRDRGQNYTCTFPGCNNNYEKGFATHVSMEKHIESRHLRDRGQNYTCTFPGCNNNQGNGFAHFHSMERHIRSIHQGQKSNCTFPGCGNNQRKGFADFRSMENHVRSKHQGQKSNCMFPGCRNKRGKGFHPTALNRHVRVAHFGQKSIFSRHSSSHGREEGSADYNSASLSVQGGGAMDQIGSYQGAEISLGSS